MKLRDAWNALPEFVRGHKMAFSRNVESDMTSKASMPKDDPIECSFADANIITSEANPTAKIHRPLLDIDLPVHIVESSSGNTHLYIDTLMTWHQYKKLLTALAECGILQEGFVKGSIERGYSSLRMPHIKKGTNSVRPLPKKGAEE